MITKEILKNGLSNVKKLESKKRFQSHQFFSFEKAKDLVEPSMKRRIKTMLCMFSIFILGSIVIPFTINEHSSVEDLFLLNVIMVIPCCFAILIANTYLYKNIAKEVLEDKYYYLKIKNIKDPIEFILFFALFITVISLGFTFLMLVLDNQGYQLELYIPELLLGNILMSTLISVFFVSLVNNKRKKICKDLKTTSEIISEQEKYEKREKEYEEINDSIKSKINIEFKNIINKIETINDLMHLEFLLDEMKTAKSTKTQLLSLSEQKLCKDYKKESIKEIKMEYFNNENNTEILNC